MGSDAEREQRRQAAKRGLEAFEADPEPEVERVTSTGRYLAAYAEGVSKATGGSYAPPTDKHEVWGMGRMVKFHGGGRKGDDLLAWIRDTSEAYAKARAGQAAAGYERGYAPSKCVEWLNAGRPVALPSRANGNVPRGIQPSPTEAPWLTDEYHEETHRILAAEKAKAGAA